MWKVTSPDGGGTVYLFGSIHVGDSSYWELSDIIMNAYEASDALAVELDIDNLSEDPDIQEQIRSAMTYQNYPSESLEGHIGYALAGQTIEYLRSYSSQVGKLFGVSASQIDFSAFDMFTPAAISGLIGDMAAEQAHLTGDWGVDSKFLQKAKEDGKQIIELEEFAMQFDLLYNMSDVLAGLILESDISVPLDYHASSLKELYNKWKAGDLASFAAEADAEVDFTGSGLSQEQIDAYIDYQKRMGVDRNIPMAEKAAQMIDDGQNVFYIVGEMHMVGRNGIASLLESEGYIVELLSGRGVSAPSADSGNDLAA
jgi:uncharacterized protein YbaP (TraB family)